MNYKLLLFFLLVGLTARAQNSVKPDPDKDPLNVKVSASKKHLGASPTLKHPYDWYFDKKVEEYEERMKEKSKEYKKLARLMEKPQYSDPSYFGHKHKPKKRPPGKRKFCKECGIVH